MSTHSEVEDWFVDRLGIEDDALARARARAAEQGLPPVAVSPLEGALLGLLARVRGARRILEVGTLGGYSTIWLARALPDGGQVFTLEIDPHHAEVARASLDDAGVGDRVDIQVGPALETLPTVAGPFDMVFVDADKENNAGYVRGALDKCAPGALLIVDNVVRDGRVADAHDDSAQIRGVREVVDLVVSDPRLTEVSALQTVGGKGWDGMLMARVQG